MVVLKVPRKGVLMTKKCPWCSGGLIWYSNLFRYECLECSQQMSAAKLAYLWEQIKDNERLWEKIKENEEAHSDD